MTQLLNATYSIYLNDNEIAFAYFQNPYENTVCEITFLLHVEGTNSYYRRYEIHPPLGDDSLLHTQFILNSMPQFFNGAEHEFAINQKRKSWKLNIEDGIQDIIILKDNTVFGFGTYVYLPDGNAPIKYNIHEDLEKIISDINNNHT